MPFVLESLMNRKEIKSRRADTFNKQLWLVVVVMLYVDHSIKFIFTLFLTQKKKVSVGREKIAATRA